MIVYDYFSLKNLSKLGMTLGLDSIYDFDVDAFNIIASTINDERDKEMKKSRKRK